MSTNLPHDELILELKKSGRGQAAFMTTFEQWCLILCQPNVVHQLFIGFGVSFHDFHCSSDHSFHSNSR